MIISAASLQACSSLKNATFDFSKKARAYPNEHMAAAIFNGDTVKLLFLHPTPSHTLEGTS